MHYVGKFRESALAPHPVFAGHSSGYAAVSLVDRSRGSVHTGLSINHLDDRGTIATHVHSFEEGFYVLDGRAVVTINGAEHPLGPGDYGALKVGTPHAWRADGGSVRWLQMAAPQPKPVGAERDTFFVKGDGPPKGGHYDGAAKAAPYGLLGHFDASQIPPVGQRTNVAPGLEGVFLKWMVDEDFGARHHRLLFIEYQPGVGIGLHDHTFEEAYFILEGQVHAVLDGKEYDLAPGDIVWTGVGCVHSFKNISSEPVRWLETFAPQPPKENVFRFMGEWEAKGRDLEGK
jgi:quercetin dioxygenase-like cupin family protein